MAGTMNSKPPPHRRSGTSGQQSRSFAGGAPLALLMTLGIALLGLVTVLALLGGSWLPAHGRQLMGGAAG